MRIHVLTLKQFTSRAATTLCHATNRGLMKRLQPHSGPCSGGSTQCWRMLSWNGYLAAVPLRCISMACIAPLPLNIPHSFNLCQSSSVNCSFLRTGPKNLRSHCPPSFVLFLMPLVNHCVLRTSPESCAVTSLVILRCFSSYYV